MELFALKKFTAQLGVRELVKNNNNNHNCVHAGLIFHLDGLCLYQCMCVCVCVCVGDSGY